MLPHLKHALADRLHVAQITQRGLAQPTQQAAMRHAVPEARQPCVEFVGALDREYEQIVIERLRKVKSYPADLLRRKPALAERWKSWSVRGHYGIGDTHRALQEARRVGVRSYCVTIDRRLVS